MNGETVSHYKCRQLNGFALVGRGMMPIYDYAADKLRSVKGFDEAVQVLGAVMRESLHQFFLDTAENEIPEGYSVEELLEIFSQKDQQTFQAFNCDASIVGYSEKNKSFGVADTRSYRNDFEVQEIYKDNYIWFMDLPTIKKYAQRLGHVPFTKEEMAEGLRIVYKEELKKHKGKAVLGGGDIDCTIIRKDGITVEDFRTIGTQK